MTPVSGKYFDNINPATGEVYSLIPDSDNLMWISLSQLPKLHFEEWSEMPKEKRSGILIRISEIIKEKSKSLRLRNPLTTESRFRLARTVDIPRAVSNFSFYATAALA